MNKLQIGDNLTLPVEAVTQTFAILAKRGVGKSYLASVMAEEMLKAGQQIIAIDPTGAWHGLRSSADGKSPGFPIVVIGGEQADVPLNESAGEIIAQAIVENRFSAIIDLSLLRKGQVRRFLSPFLETLYRLNREPLHLFVDEADDVAPQKPFGDEAQLVGALEDIVKRGRKKGIGCTLITQRPADLAKQVLTQCEVLVAMRIVHPRDIAAIKEWVNVHGDPAIAKTMIDSLAALPIGTAWFWSPGWLGEMRQSRIRRRETFDSSATPKVGEQPKKPKARAAIDIAALGRQISDAAEQSKANDPKELKKRIAELEKQLRERPAETKTIEVEKIVEVPMFQNGELDRTEKIIGHLIAIADKASDAAGNLRSAFAPAVSRPGPMVQPKPLLDTYKHVKQTTQKPQIVKQPIAPTGDLTGPQQAILDTVLMLDARGIAANRDTVARWLGIHPNGGSYGANLGRLRGEGYLDGFRLTELGTSTARQQTTGVEAALAALDEEPKRRIIRTLIEVGRPVSRDELAEILGLHPNGGSYGANLGWLRTMGIITPKGLIAPTDGLFR